LAKELVNYKLGLISAIFFGCYESDVFFQIYTYEQRLITSFKNIFLNQNIKNIFQRVDNTLFINNSDILLVHTGYIESIHYSKNLSVWGSRLFVGGWYATNLI
jgi:hypothetical protein